MFNIIRVILIIGDNMDKAFRKLCHYFITDGEGETLEEIQEMLQEDFEETKEKAKLFVEKLTAKTKELGYTPDFESFCNLLEEYINNKDKMADEEKTKYLKILMTLSEIHEINLREELERYVSYKQKEPDEQLKKEIFYEFCRYNVKPNNDVEDFNKLKDIAISNSLDFKELQKEAIMFVEETKILAESLGYDIETDSFDYIVQSYLKKKSKLNDYDKSRYLKVLLYLSEIYNENLRARLTEPTEKSGMIEEVTLISIFNKLTNPLDNESVLSELLDQRYHSGYFDIKEITFAEEKPSNEEVNYPKIQASLAYKIYHIFLDKFNNYAFDDLNEEYTNLISEDDLQRLEEITEDEILNIIELINKHESSHYISKKYQLTDNLYTFIEKSIFETLDLKKEHIGTSQNSLFNIPNENYTIRLYINGPELETAILLEEYIKKCVEKNVNYDMKALGDNKEDQEGSIIYANINDIVQKINIINEIIEEAPQLRDAFYTPIYSSGRLNDSIYGISHSGVMNEYNKCVNSYNDYFNNICEVSYYRTLSKIIIEILTDQKAKGIISNFIALTDVSFNKAEMMSPELAEYNNVSFEVIKDLVNQYIPLVNSTLNIYMTDPDKKNNLITEFKKSMLYISNICQNRDKRTPSNIAISSYIEENIKNN